MKISKSFDYLKVFIVYILFIFTIVSINFNWLKVELFTFLYQNNIGLDDICKKNSQYDFKYSKVIDFENYKNTAVGYCIYKQSKENTKITLNKNTDRWIIIYSQKLNTDNNLYWPIYL